jgi:hypothetical protein
MKLNSRRRGGAQPIVPGPSFVISKNSQQESAIRPARKRRTFRRRASNGDGTVNPRKAGLNVARSNPRVDAARSQGCTHSDSHPLADLNQHRFDEIGGEKPRTSLPVGDKRDHHGAA